MLTLLGDGLISHADAIKTAVNWWESDSIAIISFAPLLLIYGSPRLTRLDEANAPSTRYSLDRTIHRTFANWMMIGLQGGSVLFALWLVFFCDVAIPYQPVYILFHPGDLDCRATRLAGSDDCYMRNQRHRDVYGGRDTLGRDRIAATSTGDVGAGADRALRRRSGERTQACRRSPREERIEPSARATSRDCRKLARQHTRRRTHLVGGNVSPLQSSTRDAHRHQSSGEIHSSR